MPEPLKALTSTLIFVPGLGPVLNFSQTVSSPLFTLGSLAEQISSADALTFEKLFSLIVAPEFNIPLSLAPHI